MTAWKIYGEKRFKEDVFCSRPFFKLFFTFTYMLPLLPSYITSIIITYNCLHCIATVQVLAIGIRPLDNWIRCFCNWICPVGKWICHLIWLLNLSLWQLNLLLRHKNSSWLNQACDICNHARKHVSHALGVCEGVWHAKSALISRSHPCNQQVSRYKILSLAIAKADRGCVLGFFSYFS